MRSSIIPLSLALLAMSNAADVQSPEPNYVPRDGYVPDSQTAARIAEAVLLPVYGKALISKQLPLIARLEGTVWIVEGRLPKGATLGGVAMVKLAKANGAILHMSHGR